MRGANCKEPLFSFRTLWETFIRVFWKIYFGRVWGTRQVANIKIADLALLGL